MKEEFFISDTSKTTTIEEQKALVRLIVRNNLTKSLGFFIDKLSKLKLMLKFDEIKKLFMKK